MFEMMRNRTRFGALLMVVVLCSALVAACGSDDDDPTATSEPPPAASAPTQAADPTEEPAEPTDEAEPTEEPAPSDVPTIEIDAADFAFHGVPASLDAGWVNLHFTNSGAEPHHAQFVKLDDGVTVDQVMAAMQNPDPSEAFTLMSFKGGPGMITNGQVMDVALELDEGSYMMLCFISGEDGVPHLAKGMIHSFEVGEGVAHSHSAPEADLTLDMHDFGFDIPEGLQAGFITMEVVNSGEQPHELALMKLQDGKTLADVQAWMETGEEGPPPGNFAGGVQAIDGGDSTFVTMHLDAGIYIAVCFIPDPASGNPHFALGMMSEFSIE